MVRPMSDFSSELMEAPDVRWTLTHEGEVTRVARFPLAAQLISLTAVLATLGIVFSELQDMFLFFWLSLAAPCLMYMAFNDISPLHKTRSEDIDKLHGDTSPDLYTPDWNASYKAILPRTHERIYYSPNDKKTVVTFKHWGGQILWYKTTDYISPLGLWDETYLELRKHVVRQNADHPELKRGLF